VKPMLKQDTTKADWSPREGEQVRRREPNFIALLNCKPICVLTVAEKFA
jgi:hypothetical protein